MKQVLTAALCCLSLQASFAQDYVFPEVKDQNEVIRDLFELKQDDVSHHFTIKINKGEYLVFELDRLSDWQGKEAFRNDIERTLPVLRQYADSLKKPLSTKRLDVHIPIPQSPVISRFTEHRTNSNLQALETNASVALKITVDTLRILHRFPDRKSHSEQLKVAHQYTFMVKDLSGAEEILKDGSWAMRTAQMIDSVVAVYRKKWNNQDAWNHNLFVSFDDDRKAGEQLRIMKQVSEEHGVKTQDMLTSSVGFGAALMRNTLCPSIDAGFQLDFYSDHESTLFTRVSLNSFTRFEEQANKQFKAYGTAFVNAEVGFGVNTGNSKLKPYSLSMGFGYKLLSKKQEDRDPNLPRHMYRLFFNYGLTRSVIVTPEVYFNNFKSSNQGWMGLSVHFRLF